IRPMLYGRLQAFHDFLVNQYQIEEPDWTAIRSDAGAQILPRFSDANYLTDQEYSHVLDALIAASDLSTRERMRCAWLVFLGFRFGVRFGEAWRLQYREAQYDGSTGQMCIWIRNSAQGEVKTLAGSRIIPLLESLTETEISILKDVLQYGEQGFTNNPLFPLMAETTTHCTLENHHIVVKHIHAAMRSVTGDPHIRFHHLRHSWATRLFAYMHFSEMGNEIGESTPLISKQVTLEAEQEYFGSLDNSRHLKSISTAMGHVAEVTSLTSYGHSLDAIAASIAQHRAPRLSDHATAYATGIVHATVRSRRRRNRDSLSLAMNRHVDASINLPPVKTLETREDVKISFRRDSCDPITLSEIDLLLCLSGSSNLETDVLAKMLHITSETTKRVIAKATEIEIDSGFDKYNLTATLQDPLIQSAIADSTLPNGCLSTLETKRSRDYLHYLTTWLQALSPTNMHTLERGLDAWRRSYTPDGQALIVTSVHDARCLVQYYELLPDPLKGVFRLPTDYAVSATLLNKLQELGWPIEEPHAKVRRAPMKSSKLRRARVELRLTQVGPRLKTAATAHRVSYLLSVFLQITGVELDICSDRGIGFSSAQ
ncbi:MULTISPECIES: tyrosine-type recombinase/integrase, partial [unclassified Ectothiorhodospira]|uniref:tyrosine-type recombinase/integrase n=1 Tax=unclassified Ectothiorhodospira TaxID=2684909 RepID=UPI001EE880B8